MARLVITVDSPSSTAGDFKDQIDGLQSGDLGWDDVLDLESDDDTITFEIRDAA